MKNKKILIIDDDPGILEVIQIVLEEKGYEVFLDDGRNVQQTVEEEKPDLILLDILLAGRDGKLIARSLKGHKKTAHIPIIFVSANLNLREKALEAGVNAYLQKPFNIEELEQIVKKNLTRASASPDR